MQLTIEHLKPSDGPVFVWCHLMVVHDYIFPAGLPDEAFRPRSSTAIDEASPQSWRVAHYGTVEKAVSAYDTSIAYADLLVGHLFDYVRREAPNTILIVTSDHGEEFLDHGGYEHVRTLYNELLRVPFVAWGPGVPVGESDVPTSSIDIAPTLIATLGLARNANLLGRNLFDLETEVEEPEVFAEMHHRGPFERFAVLRNGQKLIVNERKSDGVESLEFYEDGLGDESDDAADRVDPETLQRLLDRVGWWKATVATQFRNTVGETARTDLRDVDIQHLKALGYVH